MPAPSPSPQSSITLNDVYYVLFRHKWMILGFAAAGILVAAIFYLALPTTYSSEAKLLVRYVMENRSMAAPTEKDQVKSPDSRGETIINSELEILTSLDLWHQPSHSRCGYCQPQKPNRRGPKKQQHYSHPL